MRTKRYVPAIDAFDEAYRTFPNHKALLNKASALLDSGRWAEAILAYERYLADPAVTGGDDSRVNEVHDAIARARKRMGGREVSITNVGAAQRWLRKGVTRYEASNYARALEAFDRSYDLHPLADLRYNQAACLDKMGKKLVAANRYEMYLDEKPDAADAKRVRDHITKLRTEARDAGRSAFDEAQVMYLQGRYARAADLFLQAFEHTGIPDLLYNHAKALDMAQDKMKALRAYAKYLQLVPQGADSDKVRARIRVLQQETGNELMFP